MHARLKGIIPTHSNNTAAKAPFGKLKATTRAIIALGWNDRIAGRGYHQDYDKWNERLQRRYENGRLVASNLLAIGHKGKPAVIPADIDLLRGYVRRPYSAQTYWKANRTIGHWRPLGHSEGLE